MLLRLGPGLYPTSPRGGVNFTPGKHPTPLSLRGFRGVDTNYCQVINYCQQMRF